MIGKKENVRSCDRLVSYPGGIPAPQTLDIALNPPSSWNLIMAMSRLTVFRLTCSLAQRNLLWLLSGWFISCGIYDVERGCVEFLIRHASQAGCQKWPPCGDVPGKRRKIKQPGLRSLDNFICSWVWRTHLREWCQYGGCKGSESRLNGPGLHRSHAVYGRLGHGWFRWTCRLLQHKPPCR